MNSSINHLAIIMDGNGRWAQNRGHSRFWGHVRGAKTARTIIEHAVAKKLNYLTLFAFSTENWNRPKLEVNFLMNLLSRQLIKEQTTLMKNNIRFLCIGNIDSLPDVARKVVQETISLTSDNTGMTLIFALSYSGQQDLLWATQKVAEKVKAGTLDPATITEETIANHLSTHGLPNPDLIIRTSGEMRISNFYLWQAAYSELYFCKQLWPNFSCDDFDTALEKYTNAERRFGLTSEQVMEKSLCENHNDFQTSIEI